MSESKSNIIPFKRQNVRSVVMIVATSKDGIIGRDNTIPWSCKEDMNFFKQATTGNVIIMGRNTFESLNNKPLPNRINIVISSTLNEDTNDTNLMVARDIDTALAMAHEVSLSSFDRNTKHEHIFIIGGLQIYKLAKLYIDELLHSVIDINVGEGIGSDLVPENILDGPTIMEILYYNNTFRKKDVTSLYEIIHYYHEKYPNRFIFKGI